MSRPSRGLATRRKVREPARPAAAAPPSLRGRGSQAQHPSPEAAEHAAGPLQARHVGSTRSPDPGSPRTRARERPGKRLGGPGCWRGSPQHRSCSGQLAGNFPPTTGLALAFRCRRSLSRAAAFAFLAQFSGRLRSWRESGRRRPSSKDGEFPQFQGAASPAALLASGQQLRRPVPLRQASEVPLCRRQGSGCQPAVSRSGARGSLLPQSLRCCQ